MCILGDVLQRFDADIMLQKPAITLFFLGNVVTKKVVTLEAMTYSNHKKEHINHFSLHGINVVRYSCRSRLEINVMILNETASLKNEKTNNVRLLIIVFENHPECRI